MIRILIFILLFISSGCGLRPIYSNESIVRQQMSNIALPQPDSTLTFHLINALNTLLRSKSTSIYTLKLKLTSNKILSVIEKSGNIARESIVTTLNYELYNKEHQIMTQGSINMTVSYDTAHEPYATYAAEHRVGSDVAQSLAEAIYYKLMLYFMQNDANKI